MYVDLKKREFFSFLLKALGDSSKENNKELVVTDRVQVLCVQQQQDAHLIGPCRIEEADSHMMLHAAHATQHGHHQILVRTVDTDVVVLPVMVAETLPAKHEVWVIFGAGKISDTWQPIKLQLIWDQRSCIPFLCSMHLLDVTP